MTSEPLHTETLGDGDATIAFIPGIGATTRYFHDAVRPLAACARVVLVDLLGFGRSPKPWTRYSVERHVAELRRVLAPHGPLTLVGHSLGARLAVAYAARYPEQVRRLVLLSLPYFGGDARGYFRRRGRWYHRLWTNVFVAAVVCVISRRLFGWLLPHVAHGVPRAVAEDAVLHTWRSSTSTLWEVLYRYDLRADAARLPAELPVVLVHGDADTSAPLEETRRLVATHPGWRLVVLSGVDHNPLFRAPQAVLVEIDPDCRTHSESWPGRSLGAAAGISPPEAGRRHRGLRAPCYLLRIE